MVILIFTFLQIYHTEYRKFRLVKLQLLIQLSQPVVSILCIENGNRLLLVYYFINGIWNIVEITDSLTLILHTESEAIELTCSASFHLINQYSIPCQSHIESSNHENLTFPLYYLVQGNNSNEFFGVDFFNRIFQCSIHSDGFTSHLFISPTLFYANDTWKISSLCYNPHSSCLVVGCMNGDFYQVVNHTSVSLGAIPLKHSITRIYYSSSHMGYFVMNELSQLFFHTVEEGEFSLLHYSFQHLSNNSLCFYGVVDGEM